MSGSIMFFPEIYDKYCTHLLTLDELDFFEMETEIYKHAPASIFMNGEAKLRTYVVQQMDQKVKSILNLIFE